MDAGIPNTSIKSARDIAVLQPSDQKENIRKKENIRNTKSRDENSKENSAETFAKNCIHTIGQLKRGKESN